MAAAESLSCVGRRRRRRSRRCRSPATRRIQCGLLGALSIAPWLSPQPRNDLVVCPTSVNTSGPIVVLGRCPEVAVCK
jgi:hypothetical protein